LLELLTGVVKVDIVGTAGAVLSDVIEYCVAALFLMEVFDFRAQPFAAISTVTLPSADGATFAVKTVLSLVTRVLIEQLLFVISPIAKPVTCPLKVMVIENDALFVGLVSKLVIDTVNCEYAAVQTIDNNTDNINLLKFLITLGYYGLSMK
jgi:hypothetical protein